MKHLLNILSFFRIGLLPIFIWLILSGNTVPAALILILSGLSDLFDGLLARRFGWVTSLGKVLDPVADKLTQITICILFCIQFKKYAIFFAVILLKELIMIIVGGALYLKGVRFEGAKLPGKVSTFLFYCVMISLLLVPQMPNWLHILLLCIVTFVSMFSGLFYVPDLLYLQNSYSKHNIE